MAKEIIQMKNAINGNNRYPITLGSVLQTEAGGSYEDTIVKKDSEGLVYSGRRIALYGNHYNLEELGYFRQYPAIGAVQGGAVYGNKFYQFYDGGGLVIIDLVEKTKIGYYTFDISPLTGLHCGAAVFSNEFENEGDELPLVYLSDGVYNNTAVVAVFNLNGIEDSHAHIVRYFDAPGICAFDFEKSIGWSFGYPTSDAVGAAGHKKMDYIVKEFTFVQEGSGYIADGSTFAEDTITADATSSTTSVTEILPVSADYGTVSRAGKWDGWKNEYNPDVYTTYYFAGAQRFLCVRPYSIWLNNLGKANLQDVCYHNGKVYVVAGGHYDNSHPLENEVHIGVYDTITKNWVTNICLPPLTDAQGNIIAACIGESESIGIWGEKIIIGFLNNANKKITHYSLSF